MKIKMKLKAPTPASGEAGNWADNGSIDLRVTGMGCEAYSHFEKLVNEILKNTAKESK